jgi:TonB family protein
MDNRDILVVFFALSLLAHLFLFRFFNLDAPKIDPGQLTQLQKQNAVPVKLNVAPMTQAQADQSDAHQVIEVPPGPDEQPDHAKYLAERAMKAAQDIMAPPAKAFAGRAAPPSYAPPHSSAPPVSSQSLFDFSGGSGMASLPEPAQNEKGAGAADRLKLKPAEAASLFNGASGAGSSGGSGYGGGGIDFLAGAASGDITLANTYKFQYAGFFNQLKRSIVFYWNPEPALYLLPVNDAELITKVRFVVNQDGTLADMEVLSSSQYQSVDRAALSAIKNSTPVFGVPSELLDQDHQLGIICDFRLLVARR